MISPQPLSIPINKFHCQPRQVFSKKQQIKDRIQGYPDKHRQRLCFYNYLTTRYLDVEFKHITYKDLRQCSIQIKQNKAMSVMCLDIHLDFLTRQQLTYLPFALKNLSQLCCLHLNFHTRFKAFSLQDHQLQKFEQILAYCKNLQTLSLQFSNCDMLTANSLAYLSHKLLRLTNLQEFRLSYLTRQHAIWNGLSPLIHNLAKLPLLKGLHLQLYLNTTDPKTNETLLKELAKSLEQLSHLPSLNLIIHDDSNALGYRQSIPNSVLELVAPALAKFNQLKHLALELRYLSPHETKITALTDSLPDLYHFHLTIDCSKIVSNDISNFFNKLKSLHHLHVLKLNLCQTTNLSHYKRGLNKANLQTLGEALYAQKNTLKDLSLSFRIHKEIVEPIAVIHTNLLALTQLKSLKLYFQDISNIDKNALTILINALKQLTGLTYLSLNFCNCDQITTEILSSTIPNLIKLQNLREIKLSLSHSQRASYNFQVVTNNIDSLIKQLNTHSKQQH